MTITLGQFNSDPYDSVVVYILLPSQEYVYRDDFQLGYSEETGYYFESWNVDGIAQPSIQQILDSAVTEEEVELCWAAIWGE